MSTWKAPWCALGCHVADVSTIDGERFGSWRRLGWNGPSRPDRLVQVVARLVATIGGLRDGIAGRVVG
jgi:hypothetical protein